MRISIKEIGFALFFLIIIALVAVEAAESYRVSDEGGGRGYEQSQPE